MGVLAMPRQQHVGDRHTLAREDPPGCRAAAGDQPHRVQPGDVRLVCTGDALHAPHHHLHCVSERASV
jgi:hypothetical protein